MTQGQFWRRRVWIVQKLSFCIFNCYTVADGSFNYIILLNAIRINYDHLKKFSNVVTFVIIFVAVNCYPCCRGWFNHRFIILNATRKDYDLLNHLSTILFNTLVAPNPPNNCPLWWLCRRLIQHKPFIFKTLDHSCHRQPLKDRALGLSESRNAFLFYCALKDGKG